MTPYFLRERLETVLNVNRKMIPDEEFRDIAGRGVWIPMNPDYLYVNLNTTVRVFQVMIFDQFDFVAFHSQDEEVYILNTEGDVARLTSDTIGVNDAIRIEYLETIKSFISEYEEINSNLRAEIEELKGQLEENRQKITDVESANNQNEKIIEELEQKMSDMTIEYEDEKETLNDQLNEARTKLSELESKICINVDTGKSLPVEYVIHGDGNKIIIPKGAMKNEKEIVFDLDKYEMTIMKMFKAGHPVLSIEIVFNLLKIIGEFVSHEKRMVYNRAFKYLVSIGIIKTISDEEEPQHCLNSEWVPYDFYRLMEWNSGSWKYSAMNIKNPYVVQDTPYKICYFNINVRYNGNDGGRQDLKCLLRIESTTFISATSISAESLVDRIDKECNKINGKLYYVVRSRMLNHFRPTDFNIDVTTHLSRFFEKITVTGITSGVYFFDISRRTSDEVDDGSHFVLRL